MAERSITIQTRNVFTRNMWFFLMVAFAGAGSLLPWRDALLGCSLLAAFGFLWVEHRKGIIKSRIKGFRHEVVLIRRFEHEGHLEQAKEKYQLLLGKYRQIPEFTQILKECLDRVETHSTVTIRKQATVDPALIEERQKAVEARLVEHRKKAGSAEPSGRERRRSNRVSVEIQVAAVTAMSQPDLAKAAKIDNISQTGALIISQVRYSEGDTVLLSSFALPDGTSFEEVMAKIVHTTESELHQVVGLEFLYLEEDEKKRIGKYIKKTMSQQKDEKAA